MKVAQLRRATWAVLAAALVAAFVTVPARAALFDDEEARRRIEQTNLRLAQVQKQIEDRLAAIEVQLKNQGLVELFGQVEQLKSDVARLRGQIEVLNNESEQTQKRARDLYIDLDSRLRRLEGGPGANAPLSAAPVPGPAAAAPSPPASGAPPPAADAAALEQRAYDIPLDQFNAA